MIEIKNITKNFGSYTALEDISLTVEESSIYGIVGYNGAGKTTLLKLIAGMYKPDNGEILINGENVYDNGKLRSDLFFIADDMFIPRGATLEGLRKMYKGYYPSFSDKVYEHMVEAMGLETKKNVYSFSKGMKRQAEIIIAMASMPKVLILDECFDGIDPQKRNLCKKIFIEYMAESGCSMIMSSHNLQEVSDLCDHVGLINGTHLTMNVSVDDISTAYRKYRLVLPTEVTEDDFSFINHKGVKIDGKLVTIVVSNDVNDESFKSLNPVMVDSVALSLEEVFLNEMEGNDYDITKIFE